MEYPGGHGVRRDGALHVGRAATPEFAVAHFARKWSGAAPLLGLLWGHWHDVRVGRPGQCATAARSLADGDDVRPGLRDFPAIDRVEDLGLLKLGPQPFLSRSLG